MLERSGGAGDDVSGGGQRYRPMVPDVLLATDADWINDEVDASLSNLGSTVRRVRTGAEVRPAVEARRPDLVVLDLQIGNMGGMATCMELRLEESGGRLDHVPVLMLLDRQADTFLARRCDAEGWLVKPFDSFGLRHAAEALLAGRVYRQGDDEPADADAPAS